MTITAIRQVIPTKYSEKLKYLAVEKSNTLVKSNDVLMMMMMMMMMMTTTTTKR